MNTFDIDEPEQESCGHGYLGVKQQSDKINQPLTEVSSVDEAKEYLKSVCFYSFKDKTFESYIETKLAGDFAIEIANVLIREKNKKS